MIEWKDDEGRLNGVLEFTIERKRGKTYLRRWSVKRDGTPVSGGIEMVSSVKEAKAYAATLTKRSPDAGNDDDLPPAATPT